MNNDLSSKVLEGLSTFDTILSERDTYRHSSEQWERAYQLCMAENEALRARLHQTESGLGYYMRHSVELRTQLEFLHAGTGDALRKAHEGAYRSNGAVSIEKVDTGKRDDEDLPSIVREGPDLSALEKDLIR